MHVIRSRALSLNPAVPYNAYHFHPQKFNHENFCFKQIIHYPRNFISPKINCSTVLC